MNKEAYAEKSLVPDCRISPVTAHLLWQKQVFGGRPASRRAGKKITIPTSQKLIVLCYASLEQIETNVMQLLRNCDVIHVILM